MNKWDPKKSAELYRVPDWGSGYFSIGENGHVLVSPKSKLSKDLSEQASIDLYELTSTLIRKGIELPIIYRFDEIIASQVNLINQAFQSAIKEYDYSNTYRLAFPIKVNQQRHVVEAVCKAGRPYSLGIEVGSKPELISALAIYDDPQGMVLCNGYKDAEYLELALVARKVGIRSVIIIEQFYELESLLEKAERMGIEPEIGFRLKPFSRGVGRWETSGGENAKFGLSVNQIIRGVELLKANSKDHWLRLLHVHAGSQMSSILAIKRVLKEVSRTYVELKRLCPSLCMLDVGGGLGVDYDGSKASADCSVDYTVEEYARDVVWSISSLCEEEGIEAPEIISESGRATVAHHAVLVTDVTDVSPGKPTAVELEISEESPRLLEDLREIYQKINLKNYRESFHDASGVREEILNGFLEGTVSLKDRAYAEDLFRLTIAKARELSIGAKRTDPELEKIDKDLRDTYFCSFSLFQSAPDSWAIDQLFPILPIHRLEEEPTQQAIIADLTCDSDGKIDQFIDLEGIRESLPLHTFSESKPYYLGIFLIGAYQETLGDLHNLFGDPNAVHVNIGEDGIVRTSDVVEGDTVREVLSYVNYDVQELVNKFRGKIDFLTESDQLSPEESAEILQRFKRSLDGYTYYIK